MNGATVRAGDGTEMNGAAVRVRDGTEMNGTTVRAGDGTEMNGTTVRAGDGTEMNGATVRAGDVLLCKPNGWPYFYLYTKGVTSRLCVSPLRCSLVFTLSNRRIIQTGRW